MSGVEAENYKTLFDNAEEKKTPFKDVDITTMPMKDIFSLVELNGKFHKFNLSKGEDTTAIGKYQMVGNTLRDLKNRNVLKELGIDDNTLFNENTQDKIAVHLAERRVRQKFSMTEARKEMRNEWEGFKKLSDKELCFLYNIAHVGMNMASNEGFGLGTCEALMCSTPISVNVTGGLQDQCGFKYKDKFITYKDYSWIHSLHDDKKWKDNEDLTHGEWVKPVWPSNRSLQGSIPTPYIYDDRPRSEDFADALKEWYDMGDDERKRCGKLGHEFVMSDDASMSATAMSNLFIEHMDTAFEKWTPRKRFTMFKA